MQTGTPTPVPPLPPTTPPLSLAPREVTRGSLVRQELALTFDCGGHAGPTRDILETLAQADVRATFFMIGDWVRAHPDLAREIAARHEIAHHSDHHPDYPSLSDAAIAADLEAGERTFIEVMGRGTKPLWRAPSGARDARVLAATARAGWPLHVFWTQERDARGELVSADSGDWRDFTPQQVAANLERAADLGNGVITVSHCDSEQTRAVLGSAIEAIRARGLRLVTVSELLRDGSPS
ncbi:MAG: polysaccharide deacetylase family protein [Dehalococcoidia bacterium]